ncbi:hypothetical protein [Corynebacterium callunae]|uniref:hypothetical protein n=1 Tax=Corynebacterium callunae TaxID=1721 RepID=UPI001FFF4A0E|nr:hypothetical protein [Corynebacterium callunae]MCK2200500.1 hypothetical protein [Corynebacterium callunae]
MSDLTISQLELYVQAIDLYESDEAQWLRDKRLEKGGLLAMLNPEMAKIVLAVDDAKTELAVNSVEIARQLIAAEKELQQLKEMMEVEHAFASVTRLTVVGGSRRILETWGISNVAMALQDDGRTLKIFYREGNND